MTNHSPCTGLLAETIEVAKDRSWIQFNLHKNAKFSDGKPVTVEDVIFSHSLLRDKGRPNHRTFYSKVKSVDKVGTHGVKFSFKKLGDREIPLIIGLMPILPKHHFTRENFETTSLEKPIGSGPYTVKNISIGKTVLFEKNQNYWGKDLPVFKRKV